MSYFLSVVPGSKNSIAIMDAKNEGEKSKQIEIAKRMLKKETDINFISECTGLSIEEINELKV